MLKSTQHFLLVTLCLLLVSSTGWSQELSRWSLGTPSIVIELPDSPRATQLPWLSNSEMTLVPRSWASETDDIKLEIARVSSTLSAEQFLSRVNQMLNLPASDYTVGEISGKKALCYQNNGRLVLVAKSPRECWAVVMTHKTDAGVALAQEILTSIEFDETEAPRWRLENLGNVGVLAELPYTLSTSNSFRSVEPGVTRLGSAFGTTDIQLHIEQLQKKPGYTQRWDMESTIQKSIDSRRDSPGVNNFRTYREQIDLDGKIAEKLVMTFTEKQKRLRITKVYIDGGSRSAILDITTRSDRPESLAIEERILNSLRWSKAQFSDWEPRKIGDGGLIIDLPRVPDTKDEGSHTYTHELFTGPMAVSISEVIDTFDVGRDLDQLVEMVQTVESMKSDIEDFKYDSYPLYVDGLPARMLQTTYKRGNFQNIRDILIISGPDRHWLIHGTTTVQDSDYLTRLFQSTRVELPDYGDLVRQRVGKSGFSFLYGDQPLDIQTQDTPDNTFVHQHTAVFSFDGGRAMAFEMRFIDPQGDFTEDTMAGFVDELTGDSVSSIEYEEICPVEVDGFPGFMQSLKLTRGSISANLQILLLKDGQSYWGLLFQGGAHDPDFREICNQAFNSVRHGSR